LEQFANDVLDRFRNPFIRHELISISLNSISKFKVRVLPSILEYHRIKGLWPTNLILSFAALLAFYKGEIDGESIPLKDDEPVMAFFEEVWKDENLEAIVEKTLAKSDFWGMDLSQLEGLKDAVLGNLKQINVES
jgi:tagaturonate reductase